MFKKKGSNAAEVDEVVNSKTKLGSKLKNLPMAKGKPKSGSYKK